MAAMEISYFLTFRDPTPGARLSDADRSRFVDIVGTTPGLRQALIFTPESAADPYVNDGPAPQLAAQLYFADIADLEAALSRHGHLQALAAPRTLSSLAGAAVSQQAMLARSFSVPDPVFRTAPGARYCTYLVSYEGEAQDLNAWLDHYIGNHPAIMARFPGIREIEVCTRVDWRGFVPWPRADHMLRNKVVFDSCAALSAALASLVRHEMREDYKSFPQFTGPVSHYPMATVAIMRGPVRSPG